ncbi:hypothetical protein PCL_03804 [Purpureocillium lilacinum]|uniref:Uncharacterized protein n=1 Tax=Purpureocillium lilacinum TaxID=33203 RepID=A0A2U3EQ58_PURLI|nr:hypothetical protein PCL_03804 [Purpureocillium lilacinum]
MYRRHNEPGLHAHRRLKSDASASTDTVGPAPAAIEPPLRPRRQSCAGNPDHLADAMRGRQEHASPWSLAKDAAAWRRTVQVAVAPHPKALRATRANTTRHKDAAAREAAIRVAVAPGAEALRAARALPAEALDAGARKSTVVVLQAPHAEAIAAAGAFAVGAAKHAAAREAAVGGAQTAHAEALSAAGAGAEG